MINAMIFPMLFVSASVLVWLIISTGMGAIERFSKHFTTTTENRLRQLFVFTDIRRIFVGYIAAIAFAILLLLAFDQSPIVIALVIGALLLTPKWTLARLAAKRAMDINKQLPDALQQISGAMRAGSTFVSALQNMVEERPGAISQEFSLLLRENRLGTGLEEALDNLGERVQTEEMDLVISAVLISQEVGGNLSEILQRLSITIRRKLEMEGKVKALTAQGVLQGRVVTLLPFAILMALLVIEPEAIEPIFTGVLGWVFLAIILCMQCLGGLMIRKIIRIRI